MLWESSIGTPFIKVLNGGFGMELGRTGASFCMPGGTLRLSNRPGLELALHLEGVPNLGKPSSGSIRKTYVASSGTHKLIKVIVPASMNTQD